MFVIDYDCITAAGESPEVLMNALNSAKVCSYPAKANQWNRPVVPGGLVSLIQNKKNLTEDLSRLWNNILNKLPSDILSDFSKAKVGLIFSSTKGNIEDYIFDANEKEIRTQKQDPFIEVVEGFKKLNPEINFSYSITVSNACSSSHVAMEFIQDLFEAQRLDYVLLLAGDLVGPFVYSGFNSLKVLSHTQNIPFSENRDGLQLGEALTAVLLSRKFQKNCFEILKVASDTEGSSITRPSVNGKGLVRTLHKLKESFPEIKPDLIIAHGTGTKFNDLAEDQALTEFLSEIKRPQTPVTGVKWSVGHTLGASGTVDLIAGCEVLKTQKAFPIGSHHSHDAKLSLNYLLGIKSVVSGDLNQIIITSLGFGGVHASLLLQRTSL